MLILATLKIFKINSILTHTNPPPNIISLNDILQSILDMVCSVVLLLMSVTQGDVYSTRHSGALGWLVCAVWNYEILLWGLILSSTLNIVTLTFER